MAEIKVQDIAIAKETAIKLYKGESLKFSNSEASDSIRNIILEAGGCLETWNPHVFQKNKYDVFQVIEEIISPVIVEAVLARFDSWVDVAQINLGDIIEYEVMNMDLFEVGYVADGTSDIRRQRLVNGKLPMTSFQLGAAVYCEWDEFRRGTVDFGAWIERMTKSFEVKIGQIIVKQLGLCYNGLGAAYKKGGTYSDDAMLELVNNVEAKAGVRAVIYGTKVALANLRKSSQAMFGELDKNDIRNMGYVGMFAGTRCVEIPQTLDRKDNKMIDDNMLFVVPDGVKMVKLVFEGGIDIFEVNSEQVRKDLQYEWEFVRRMQLGVCRANVYGMYKLSE